jgi:Galactose mutarotase and related enzymes
MIPADAPILLANDAVRLELLPLGATVRRLEVATQTGWRNIVLGHPGLADYVGNVGYFGASVGRFANRVANARFSLDGVEYQLLANEGPNHIHGGPGGFSTQIWDVASSAEDFVEFTLTSADGDQGYPGELTVSARYELIPGGVQITYRATTDAPTVINLTTHPYFNLDGEGAGDTNGHRLFIHSSAYTPNYDDGIPTGEIREVAGSAADFRTGPLFGAAREQAEAEGITRNGGFDHNFIVDGEGLREHCRLVGGDGLTLTIRSNQVAIQVYGGEHLSGLPGTSGRPYPRRAGIALETQNFPDAPNHANFPSSVLRPGEEYVALTQWLLA